MRRTEWLQETRLMRFEDAYEGWTENRSYPGRGALLLGGCVRTFLFVANPAVIPGNAGTPSNLYPAKPGASFRISGAWEWRRGRK